MMASLRVWRPTRRPLEYFHRVPLDGRSTGCGLFLGPGYGWYGTAGQAEMDVCKPCPDCFTTAGSVA